MQCQVCQQPMVFTEPDSPRWIAYRETAHNGETFHCCSDHCADIFAHEPAKYVQARLPSHEALHLHRDKAGVDSLVAGLPKASAAECGIDIARDSGEFHHSEDAMNFETWGGGQDMKEAQL